MINELERVGLVRRPPGMKYKIRLCITISRESMDRLRFAATIARRSIQATLENAVLTHDINPDPPKHALPAARLQCSILKLAMAKLVEHLTETHRFADTVNATIDSAFEGLPKVMIEDRQVMQVWRGMKHSHTASPPPSLSDLYRFLRRPVPAEIFALLSKKSL